jgi:hypothetical protein
MFFNYQEKICRFSIISITISVLCTQDPPLDLSQINPDIEMFGTDVGGEVRSARVVL